MGHQIKAEDLALGTIERHESQDPSWHVLETVKHGLSTVNCNLRKMELEIWENRLTRNGVEYGTPLRTAAVPHPIDKGKLLIVSKTYDPASYELLDNAAFLDFAAQCFAEAGLDNTLAFTTTLYAGSRVTIAKEIPEAAFADAHGHKIRSFINLFNSFDGSWPTFVNVSEIRTVCANTANMNLREGGVSCKHTPDALNAFIKNFPTVFAEALKAHGTSANDYLRMHDVRVTKDDARAFFAALLTSQSKLSKTAYNTVNDELFPLFVKGRGCYGQTGADLYNAVTEHYTHNGTTEANAPGGTSDVRKTEAKARILDKDLPATLERGRKLLETVK